MPKNSSNIRLALGTAGLMLIVLLPFAGRLFLYDAGVGKRSAPSVVGQQSTASELMAAHRYKEACGDLVDLGEQAVDQQQQILAFQHAICDQALGRPEKSYVRYHRLHGVLPLLDDHRRLWMGRALNSLGDYDAARLLYEDLLLNARSQAVADSARIYLAGMISDEGEYGRALELYADYAESNPASWPEILYRMIEVYDATSDVEESRQARLRLMENYPAHRSALDALRFGKSTGSDREQYARALVYFRHGQQSRARKTLDRLLRSDPDHAIREKARYLQARCYLKSGEYQRAHTAFDRLFHEYGSAAALYRTGGIEIRQDQEQRAIETYARFVRSFPRHDLADDALWQAAKAAERHSHFDQAQKIYRRLASEYPEGDYADEARWSIGFMQYCRLEFAEALTYFKASGSSAREPHIVDQSLFWAAKSAFKLNRLEEAERLYESAAKGFPRSYYSTRALQMGYGSDLPLQAKPSITLNAASTRKLAGRHYLERADLLRVLGMRSHAKAELLRAERLNSGDTPALRIVRDHYEHAGILNRALVLSVKIFAAEGNNMEIAKVYPSYYWDQVAAAAREAKVDPYLVLSVIRQESFFNEDAVSRAGAIGLMQIMPQTGRILARSLGMGPFNRRQLFNPLQSIRMGSYFLAGQVRDFMEGPTRAVGFELGLAAYNAGPHVARKWVDRFPFEDPDTFVERIPYRETRLYVKKVLKNYTIYKSLAQV
jgi:soluble lytic murein transglycosylase